MIRKIIAVCLLSGMALFSNAQEIHRFTKGLVAGPFHQYGREALIKDLLAFEMYKGSLPLPVELKPALRTSENKAISWQSITADTAGIFRDEALANGYLYLSYQSTVEKSALLNISGNGMVFFNGEPRGGDIYRMGWLSLPVKIKKGLNEIMVRCTSWARWQGVSAYLTFSEKPVALRNEDSTLPHIVLEDNNNPVLGAMVVVNATAETLNNLTITTHLEGKELSDIVPVIGPFTIRKVGFRLDPENVSQKKTCTGIVQLKRNGKLIDEKSVALEAVHADEHYSNTFISAIDGSVQYYSVAPQSQQRGEAPALFLSVHGAGVEAIGQARAYTKKDWGVLVAPTNRRPRGFNWEDWGRRDALEVLALAKEKFKPDPKRIYLTGHSMGGHGTWYLGSTYPDQWAAIAPCAGYPTLKGYGSADGKIPVEGRSAVEKLLLKASNPSDVMALAKNYKTLGIYIHHGDSDKVVSVDYARQMRQLLGTFHKDFSYYEYPGGGHWFGNQSVDWQPIFDYFKWHTIPHDSAMNVIDFTTANPAIASKHYWVSVLQQEHSLDYSRIQLIRDRSQRRISGQTENIAVMSISLSDFKKGEIITVALDSLTPVHYTIQSTDDKLYLQKSDHWKIAQSPDIKSKGINRGGTFKEPFNHKMVLVYSTQGSKEENTWSYNKARYDAEVWYYRGNGSVDIIRDKDFVPAKYPDRGVIVYGNASTNAAWKKLLSNCPVQVTRGKVMVGNQQYEGDDLAAYFMWPRQDSHVASVAVISGSGLPGMNAAEANQYFTAGSGFPDYMIFSLDMLKDGAKAIKAAGFYGNDWSLEK